jgi:hypothetical protein
MPEQADEATAKEIKGKIMQMQGEILISRARLLTWQRASGFGASQLCR